MKALWHGYAMEYYVAIDTMRWYYLQQLSSQDVEAT